LQFLASHIQKCFSTFILCTFVGYFHLKVTKICFKFLDT
jgi:hypothetical protein